MAKCDLIETCIFFNDKMGHMPSMAGMYKKRYCEEDSASCARFQVYIAVGRENVPKDMYPNEADKVGGVIQAAQG